MTQRFPRECARCGKNKPPWFEYCGECYAALQTESLEPNKCREQNCDTVIPDKHRLCRSHFEQERRGVISECLECGSFKPSEYDLCLMCQRSQRRIAVKPSSGARPYDHYEGADDPKAKDKRYWFHRQNDGVCNYCGRQYPYNQLELEHMVPKARGGQDHRRNTQLACRVCNRKKLDLTDLEFRELNKDRIPFEERTPPKRAVDPKSLRARGSQAEDEKRDEHDCPAAVFALSAIGLLAGFFMEPPVRD